MNGSQDLLNTGGDTLSQTRNPQQIGGQSITVQRNDIQQPTNGDILKQKDLVITSVGSSTFQPITAVKSANTQESVGGSLVPLFIGLAVALAIIGALVMLAVLKGNKNNSSQAV